MNRYYFLTDDLNALERVVTNLAEVGIDDSQMHVLSKDDAAVAEHPHLSPVEAVLRKGVVRGTEIGAFVGLACAALVLGIAWFTGVVASVGWVPFLFLAIVVLGFCTWEGGLFGIQEPHPEFLRFQSQLNAGRHLFFVDLPESRRSALEGVISQYPALQPAGAGSATPELVVEARKKFNHVMQTLP